MRNVHKDLVEKGFMVKLDDMCEDRRKLILNAEFQHFNPWRLVMKMDSVTTPVRMVVDPSMTRMNEILAKGENRIGLIFNIMIRCRCQSLSGAQISASCTINCTRMIHLYHSLCSCTEKNWIRIRNQRSGSWSKRGMA